MKVVAFGEVLWDVIEGVPHLGGAPLNFAAHSVLCGLDSAILSAYGNDKLGNRAKDEINKLNVDTRLLQLSDYATGTVDVKLEDGIPTYVINENVAYDLIDSNEIDWDVLKEYDCLYFGTLAQRNVNNHACLKGILDTTNFKEIFLDVNLRQEYYSKEILDFSFSNCTILKLNDEEVKSISQLMYSNDLGEQSFTEKLLEHYTHISTVIITKGAEGASIFHDKVWFNAGPVPTTVGDTVGAGDAFSAAFCSRFLGESDPKEALTFANKVASYVASQRGAIPNYKPEMFV